MNPLARAGGFKRFSADRRVKGGKNPLARAGGFKLKHAGDTVSMDGNPLARAGGFKLIDLFDIIQGQTRTRSQERVDLSLLSALFAAGAMEPARKSGWI